MNTKLLLVLLLTIAPSISFASDLPLGTFRDACRGNLDEITIYPRRNGETTYRIAYDGNWFLGQSAALTEATDCAFGDTCFKGAIDYVEFWPGEMSDSNCWGNGGEMQFEISRSDDGIIARIYRPNQTVSDLSGCRVYHGWREEFMTRC